MREAVVLVHGIWSNGIDLWRLRQRLSRADYDCYLFNYHVWGKSPEKTARKLNDFVERIETPVVHFVGHSFGGIVILHMFDQFPFAKDGRIVLLASPVKGSAVGKRLARNPVTRWVLGQSPERGLAGGVPKWRGWQDIGIIAGTFPMGMGMVAGGPEAPHDGTVSVSETQLEGATDFIALPVSHSGMLLSSTVAEQVIIFLRAGKFDTDTVTPVLNSTVA
jgi:pimeloyl-ACP methyl ester carboxylesterase